MPWTLGTKTGMTVDASDLVLDAGRTWGTYETTAIDITTCCWRHFQSIIKVAISGADVSEPTFTVEIKTSPDNATWTAYFPYQDGEYYTRSYQMRITVYGNPATGQRPEINQFEVYAPPCDSVPWQGNILTTENTPPATDERGDRHLIGTGGGAWTGKDGWIAICEDVTTPTYRLIPPEVGMKFHHVGSDLDYIYDPSAGWTENDVRKTAAPHITIMAPAWSAKTAGTWAPPVLAPTDSAQLYNGYYTNTSTNNLDAITYRTGLKHVAYTLVLFGKSDVNGGIAKVYLGATLIATFDMYSNPLVNNVEYRQASITPTTAAVYDVKVKVDGKNAGSGGYECWISHISFYPE